MQSKSYIEVFKESFPDAQELTVQQRDNLLRMLHYCLVDLRNLPSQGTSEEASDLADAFHNLPIHLTLEVFSFKHFRDFLNSYQQKYRNGYRYLEMLDKIIMNEDIKL